jgi:hypothetical protein
MACWCLMSTPRRTPWAITWSVRWWRPLVVLSLAAAMGWWWQAAQRAALLPPAEQPVAAAVVPDVVVPEVPAPVRQASSPPVPAAPRTDANDCVASMSTLVRLRTAAVAASAAGHEGVLRPLLARIETEDERARDAGAALHAGAVERLRASADPATRAVGLQVAAMQPPTGRAGCRRDECLDEVRAAGQQAHARLAELAELALGSQDGQIYARAWITCRQAGKRADDVPACGQLSAERWAQLAPDTAAPWLALAEQARTVGDLAGQLNAMHGAALASDWRNPAGGLLRALLAQTAGLPSDPMARWYVDWHALSAGLQVAGLGAATMLQYCAAPLDANRQQVCNQLARRVLAAPEDLLQLRLAIHLGERVGWPAEQLVARRRELDALDAAAASQISQWAVPDDMAKWKPAAMCAGLAAMRQHVARLAELGELAALRALLPVAPAAAASVQVR